MDEAGQDRMGWGDRERQGMTGRDGTGWDRTGREVVNGVRWISRVERRQEKWCKNLMSGSKKKRDYIGEYDLVLAEHQKHE